MCIYVFPFVSFLLHLAFLFFRKNTHIDVVEVSKPHTSSQKLKYDTLGVKGLNKWLVINHFVELIQT